MLSLLLVLDVGIGHRAGNHHGGRCSGQNKSLLVDLISGDHNTSVHHFWWQHHTLHPDDGFLCYCGKRNRKAFFPIASDVGVVIECETNSKRNQVSIAITVMALAVDLRVCFCKLIESDAISWYSH
jgi:hypothetical protein